MIIVQVHIAVADFHIDNFDLKIYDWTEVAVNLIAEIRLAAMSVHLAIYISNIFNILYLFA